MQTVLLIDDDVELVEMLKEYLELEGFEVKCAHDGATGVQKALQAPLDIVVLDVMMPKLNGIDTLRAIRQQSNVPVIMLTARGDNTDRIVGLELGADDYVPKPSTRLVEWSHQPVTLTSTEFNLLEILAKNAGQVVTKQDLSQFALGRPLARFDRSIDVHLSSIRHKLGTLPDGRQCIQTVFRLGYQLLKE